METRLWWRNNQLDVGLWLFFSPGVSTFFLPDNIIDISVIIQCWRVIHIGKNNTHFQFWKFSILEQLLHQVGLMILRASKTLRNWKFSTWNFFGTGTIRSPNRHGLSFQNIDMKGGYTIFLTVFWSPEVGWGWQNAVHQQKYEVLQKSISSTMFEIVLALLNHFFP